RWLGARSTLISSGSPVSRSQHTMHTSVTPRAFSSDKMVSLNLADSPVAGPIHRPRTYLAPSQSIPIARQAARLATTPSRILTIPSLPGQPREFDLGSVPRGFRLGCARDAGAGLEDGGIQQTCCVDGGRLTRREVSDAVSGLGWRFVLGWSGR